MCGEISRLLECLKLLELFEPKREHIVIQGSRCPGEKGFEFHVAPSGIAVIDRNRAAHMTSGFTFDTNGAALHVASIQPP
jgi:hypothetical protein